MTTALTIQGNPDVSEAAVIKFFGTVLVVAIMANMATELLRPTPVAAAAVEQYGTLWFNPAGHIMNVGYGEGEEPEYFGEAIPGTLNSDAAWRIYRYEYVEVGGDLEAATLRFAEGNTNFEKVWDDREDYEYS